MSRLKNKVAIITASTVGVGFAIAKTLGKEGASIVVSSRKSDNVKKAIELLQKEGIAVTGVECHVANADQRTKLIEHALKEFGQIDILVANTGINPVAGPLMQYEVSTWDEMFDTNLKAGLMFTKLVLPHMRKKGGAIVFITSISAYNPQMHLGAYSITKTALLALTKVLANELADKKIRVNSIAPGILRTKLSKILYENNENEQAALNKVPLRRFGTPEEIGNVVAFLCSEEASYITGENVVVSGGMPSRL